MLYDRVLRSELMNSDRWLDLASDSHRLAYICLLPLADDFGNFEGGLRRLWRWLHARTQVKDEAHAAKILSDLMDADLLRCYKFADVEYWHVARFECDRRYICRRVPPSPWDDPELEKRAGAIRQTRKARIDLKRENRKVPDRLQQSSGKVAAELLIGVGVGVGEKKKKPPLPPTWPCPAGVTPEAWTAWLEVRKRSRVPVTEFAYKRAINQLAGWAEAGHNPDAIVAASAENGWKGLFEPKTKPVEKAADDHWD